MKIRFLLTCVFATAILANALANQTPLSSPEETSTDSSYGKPIVQYSFDTLTDDGGTYASILRGSASIQTLEDGNKVLFTGGANGYLDLGQDMGRAVMQQLSTDYTISIDACIQSKGHSLSRFCWLWAFAAGTNRYSGLVNAAGNGNWYYEIKDGTAYQSKTGRGLATGVWHNITVVQHDGTCQVYVDGQPAGTSSITLCPSVFASSLTQCWLGRSPFAGDAFMTNTMMDNLRIYDSALTADQISELCNQTPQTTEFTLTREERLEAIRSELLGSLAVRYMHEGATLPTTCSDGTVQWTYTPFDESVSAEWLSYVDGQFVVLRRTDKPVIVGTLQGTITLDGDNVSLYDEPLPVVVAPSDNAVGYLYCHMPNLVPETGTGTLVSQTITYALGRKEDKGLVFNELNRGSAIIPGIGTSLPWCRDAFLAKDTLRHCYYIVTTDLYGSRDNGTSMLGNYSIGMFRSYDLIHWTYKRMDLKQYLTAHPTDILNNAGTAKLTAAKVSRVWAPQIIMIDGRAYIYYAVGNTDNGDDDHFYISRANEDFTGIETFQMLYGPNRNGNILDADINYLETDQLYHMSYRDYAAGDIRDITCADLLHPEWSDEAVTTFTDGSGFEASSVFRRIDEDVWNVGNVNYSSRVGFHFHTADALLRNLKSAADLSGHVAAQHGSFVHVSQDEWDVVQRWSDINALIADASALPVKARSAALKQAITDARKVLNTNDGKNTDMHALAERLEDTFQTLSATYRADNEAYRNQAYLAALLADGQHVEVPGGDMSGKEVWTVTGGNLGLGSGVGEFFASRAVNYKVNMQQTVSGLENGTYVAYVQAFERNGDNDHYGRDYEEGVEKINFEFFAGTSSMPVRSLYSVPCSAAGNLYGFANNMATAAALFNADEENFACRLLVEVTNGKLTIGLRRPEGTVSSTNDWCCFDNFRLYKVDEADGILSPEASQSGVEPSKPLFDLSGRQLSTITNARPGIYISGRTKVVKGR